MERIRLLLVQQPTNQPMIHPQYSGGVLFIATHQPIIHQQSLVPTVLSLSLSLSYYHETYQHMIHPQYFGWGHVVLYSCALISKPTSLW